MSAIAPAAQSSDKPTLLHLEHSQSQLVLWVLEELGCPYNFRLIKAVKSGPRKGRSPEELKTTHALGRSPQLILPSGRVLVERAAITRYLIDHYDTAGRFSINTVDPENDVYREAMLMSIGAASLNPILMSAMLFNAVKNRSPFLARPITGAINSQVRSAFLDGEVDELMRYLDGELQGREYFMGTKEPTMTDFCTLWYVDFASQMRFLDLDKYTRIKAWSNRCKARPAWIKALEVSGGYDLNAR